MAIDTKEIRRTVVTPAGKFGVNAPAQEPQIRKTPELSDLKKNLQNLNALNSNGTNVNADGLKNANAQTVKQIQARLSDAGLYDAKKSMIDGKAGDLTQHALKLAADPEYAVTYLKDVALQSKDMDETGVKKMQAALNRLGYDSGSVDGEHGRKTAAALRDFLKERPELAKDIDPSFKKEMEIKLGRGELQQLFGAVAEPAQTTPAPAVKQENTGWQIPPRDANDPTLIHPKLATLVEKSPMIRSYVQMIFESAEKYDLNPRKLANQFYFESLAYHHPDSKRPIDPAKVSSNAGAMGIAQMVRDTGREYGLVTKADFYNPAKSIDAGAGLMRDIMDKFKVSQDVALIGYNANPYITIPSLRTWAGRQEVTTQDFNTQMQEQRAAHPTTDGTKIRVQTYDYVRRIDQNFWDAETLKQAYEKGANKVAPAPLQPYQGAPLIGQLQNGGNNIDTGFQLNRTFGSAASLTALENAGIGPTVTPAQAKKVSEYDAATLSEKFNLPKLGTPDPSQDLDGLDPANPKLKNNGLSPVSLG